ncbi:MULTISPECIES: hypothetical protein [unclassified Acinetobacter]|uniref:hypothetical protein n=1 Tax=unclassified Acinetobacter TaxID=196816 RepID=UPI0002CE8E5F|nr:MULTISPECIES: hypothetical protein [unclassified Acinetobacter]ENU79794.1 hypothetical protein F975_02423 [Acinetobacter sp. ANC 3789]TCB33196.1 hypothetical protein E0H86_00705 [Acinetobacter sp. ANC 4635]
MKKIFPKTQDTFLKVGLVSMIILSISTALFLKDYYDHSFLAFLVLMIFPFLYMKCVTTIANKIYESDPLGSF